MDANYIASIINSTIRQASPVLLAALGSAICSKVGIFNIALEAQMLIGSFTGIVVNYFTGSPIIAALAAILSGTFVGYIVAVLQVKFKAADMVVGTSMILLVGGLSSILLPVFFGVKGSFTSPDLVPFTKISLPIIKDIPFLSRILENLTIVDYLSYVLAIAMFVYLYKTVSGFRMLSVGINKEAATSLGIPVTRIQIIAVTISGALCALGGAVLSMGQVILFSENMTAGRGFIAMAAAGMAQSHPLYVVVSSLFFGAAQAIGVALQNTIPSQLTMAIPYVVTIIALAIFGRKSMSS